MKTLSKLILALTNEIEKIEECEKTTSDVQKYEEKVLEMRNLLEEYKEKLHKLEEDKDHTEESILDVEKEIKNVEGKIVKQENKIKMTKTTENFQKATIAANVAGSENSTLSNLKDSFSKIKEKHKTPKKDLSNQDKFVKASQAIEDSKNQ